MHRVYNPRTSELPKAVGDLANCVPGATNGGRAVGSERFKAQIAAASGRRAAPLPRGRPADEDETDDGDQLSLL